MYQNQPPIKVPKDVQKEVINSLTSSFKIFNELNKKTRLNLIKQNKLLKSKYQKHLDNKPLFPNGLPHKNRNTKYFSPCMAFSQNFFCYPIKENFLQENNYFLNFFELYPNFSEFDKSISKNYSSICKYFHFWPKTLDESEIIENKKYFIWCFIISIKNIKKKLPHFNIEDSENILKIIFSFCQILGKKLKYFYRMISWFVAGINKKVSLRISKDKASSILSYRKAYCPICFKYLCKLHFYRYQEPIPISDYYQYNDDSPELDFYIVEAFSKKTSGERTILIKSSNKNTTPNNDMEQMAKCPNYKDCKLFRNVPLLTLTGVEENHIELFKLMEKNDFYILNCLVSTKCFNNSCYFTKFFGNKYKCFNLNKIITLISNEKNITEIDNYLSYEKIGGFTLPKVSLEKMQIKIKNPSLKDKEETNSMSAKPIRAGSWIKRRNTYIPCNHPGKCKPENCNCIAERERCEKFCVCHGHCEFEIKGCKCVDGCVKTVEKDVNNKCPCIKEERECDPDLCVNCRNCKLCNNMNLYYRIYKKTYLSESLLIPTGGLFAAEDINPHEMINEYVGEMIERNELERRSTINMTFERNYGFSLTDVFDIDALRCGNQLRYVNHSSFGYENAYAGERFVRGNAKIALYAKRPIKKGEEIYFDYHMKNRPWIVKYNKLYGPSEA